MSDIIADTADEIRTMRIRGAGRLARAGVNALVCYTQRYTGGTLKSFKEDISRAADIILASRPTAVSLWNGIHETLEEKDLWETLEEALSSVEDRGRTFCSMSEKAASIIAEEGAKMIVDGDVLLTHCNSSAALGIMKEAKRQGKDFKVYATESRPWRQGLITVTELAEADIDVTMIVDSAVRTVMSRINRVFVGADTVTSAGMLINKIGTSQVASAAFEYGVQFDVCTETFKFSPKTLVGETVTIEERGADEVVTGGKVPAKVKVFNPVFDITPSKYINAYVTELGVMSPGSVYGVLASRHENNILRTR